MFLSVIVNNCYNVSQSAYEITISVLVSFSDATKAKGAIDS